MTSIRRFGGDTPLSITVLDGPADFERHLIIAPTSEGRKRAKSQGVLFGRPRKLTPHQRRENREARCR
jgi:DNA invertase Pin-like site-specific DNA recombinase